MFYHLFLGLLTAIVSFFTPHPPVDNPLVVNQGDKISIGRTDCSVAYVDSAERILYTAGHCGRSGDEVWSHGNKVGYLNRVDGYSPRSNDLAAIRITNPLVKAGENKFSGDKIVDPRDVKPGDKICLHSRIRNQDSCIRNHRTWKNGVTLNFRSWGFRQKVLLGDSGGPIWIEGKGAVAPISSYLYGGGVAGTFLKDFAEPSS